MSTVKSDPLAGTGFDPAEVTLASSRYILAPTGVSALTIAGGRVAAARLAGKPDSASVLVHTAIPSRQDQSIDMGAVATAVIEGVIPYAVLVTAFSRAGKLDALKKAIAEHK